MANKSVILFNTEMHYGTHAYTKAKTYCSKFSLTDADAKLSNKDLYERLIKALDQRGYSLAEVIWEFSYVVYYKNDNPFRIHLDFGEKA